MLEFIKASLTKLKNKNASILNHESVGRVGEGVGGKLYQHYGFRSIPPTKVDLICIQDGNNNYSIAENFSSVIYNDMNDNDVVLYTSSGVNIALNDKNSFVKIKTKNSFIEINKDDGKVTISDTNGTSQVLVTKAFLTALNTFMTTTATAIHPADAPIIAGAATTFIADPTTANFLTSVLEAS